MSAIPGLAVRGLAQRRGILRSDTHGMHAFLGYRGVVDDQHGVAATNELIRLTSSSVSTGLASQIPAAMKWCN